MKMSELRAENEALKKQIALLSEQKGSEKDSTAFTQLKEKNRLLRKSVKELNAEKAGLSDKIKALEIDLSSREQENQRLKEDIEQIQQQLTELSNVHTQTITEVESLRVEQQALREKETQLGMMRPELDRLRQVENICKEKTAQVDELQVELVQQGQLLAEARAKAAKETADYQSQNVNLKAELEAHREQSGAEIASLQAQKSSLSAQVSELTEKLTLVARHLERQLSERRKIASQYDGAVKEYQAYKVRTEKEMNDLGVLMQKMAVELDASRASHPAQEKLPSMINRDKPAKLEDSTVPDKQLQQQVVELRNQLSNLNEINAQQNHELTVLSKRMERIKAILATPQGRVFSRLFGLK